MGADNAVDLIMDVAQNPPSNEADTCNWVILPVLYELGYAPKEVSSQNQDAAGNKPDYTVLRETPDCWYLEAKAWNAVLTDQHAAQATGYTYQSGRRWAVLSNGRTWRLYDASIQDPSARLVCDACLADVAELPALLGAIARESVLSGALESFASHTRLYTVLRKQLADPKSDVIGAIVAAAKKAPLLKSINVSRDAVVGFLAERMSAVQPPEFESVHKCPPQTTTDMDDLGQQSVPLSMVDPTGNVPWSLVLPDGKVMTVNSWKSLCRETLCWSASHAQEPLPSLPLRIPLAHADSVASAPVGNEGPMRAPIEIPWSCGLGYVEAHASAANLVWRVCGICTAIGVDPASFNVCLKA